MNFEFWAGSDQNALDNSVAVAAQLRQTIFPRVAFLNFSITRSQIGLSLHWTALEGNKVEPLSLCFCLGKLQTINSALALSPWCKFRRKDDTRLVYAWPPINTWCFLAAPHMVAKTKHAALMSRYYDLAHSVIMNQFEACWSILVSVGICEFQERSRRQRP